NPVPAVMLIGPTITFVTAKIRSFEPSTFHVDEYGGANTSAPRFAPSRLNWTPTTPTLSDAAAVTGTVPETMAPDVGAVIVTDGGAVSRAAGVANVKSPDVAVLPAASRERTR